MSSPRLPLSARPSFLPDEISRREFATVFRGYDPAEVRTFLNQLSEQAAEAADRVAEVQNSLAELSEQVKNPELDEEMVTKLLGEQTAQILRSAREAAKDTRERAEEEVSTSLREAHEVTTKMREEAETLLADRTEEAELVANTVRAEASEAAEKMTGDAEKEAASIRAIVDEEVASLRASTEAELEELHKQSLLDIAQERAEAKAAAREIVANSRKESEALVERTQEKQVELVQGLVRKRKIALAQVEELRAGRARLYEAYKTVRSTLDDVTAELERVEEEAKKAADEAGLRSAQNNAIPADELDTVIELEQFELEDDVPADVINLINSTQEEEEAAHASVVDVDDSSGDGTGGGGAGGDSEETGSVATMTRQETKDVTIFDQEIGLEEEDDDNSATTSFVIGGPVSALNEDEMDKGLKLRRDAVVNKARSQAVRRLKRSLQDEQDALVARLRTGDAENVQALLGSTDDQAAGYQRAVVKLFREVVRGGATSLEAGNTVERSTIDQTGTSSARSMAMELVEDLRNQLTPVLEELIAGEELPDNSTLQSLVAAPYRVLKTAYLDQLVDDRIGGAFDQGVAFSR